MDCDPYYMRLLLLGLLIGGAAADLFTSPSPRIEIPDGKLRGKYVLTREGKKIRAFLGIPYAEPPVDELRFKNPVPLKEGWEKERWAVDHPKPCVQPERRHGEPIGREDCLYLNIYTPESVAKRQVPHPLTKTAFTTVQNTTADTENNNKIFDNTINGTIVEGSAVNVTSTSDTDPDGMTNEIPVAVNVTTTEGNATTLNGTSGKNTTEPCPLLPVMVFFHGGGFEAGHSEPFTQEYLLDSEVIVVTVQYRLGLLGFFSTGDEVLPGNLGLKDQRLALKWIQENIEYFGGCPEKVTIFGDGAGGASVHYHLLFTDPKIAPFRAGISMSGTALSPWAFRPPVEVAQMAKHIAKLARCPSSESNIIVECLRLKRAEDLVKILQMYKNETLGGCGEWALAVPGVGPVLEPCGGADAFVRASPWDMKVSLPWMVGVTSKEWLYEFTPQLVDRRDKLFNQLDLCFNQSFPKVLGYNYSNASVESLAGDIRRFYLKGSAIKRDVFADIVEAVSDAAVVYPTFEAVRRAGRRSTWLYLFDYIGSNTYGPTALDGRIAPGRGDDLFFFFPRPLGKSIPRKTKEPDTILSKLMIKFWTSFASTLDPTPSEDAELKWVPVTPSTTFLHIGQSGMKIERPFLSYRMNFWSMEDFPRRDDDYRDSVCPVEEEPEQEVIPDGLPEEFLPSLKWKVKSGYRPMADAVDRQKKI